MMPAATIRTAACRVFLHSRVSQTRAIRSCVLAQQVRGSLGDGLEP
jgi:hypothetical protein